MGIYTWRNMKLLDEFNFLYPTTITSQYCVIDGTEIKLYEEMDEVDDVFVQLCIILLHCIKVKHT